MARNSNRFFKENWIVITIGVVIFLLFSKPLLTWLDSIIRFIIQLFVELMDKIRGKSKTTTPSSGTSNKSGVRGIRNNNPGNIKISSANPWTGKIQNNTDGVYEQFTEMKYGIRASLKLLHTYIETGRSTLRKIGDSWAEKDPTYWPFLVQEVGLSADTAILINDQATIKKIAQAIFMKENGRRFTSAEIDEAWKLL